MSDVDRKVTSKKNSLDMTARGLGVDLVQDWRGAFNYPLVRALSHDHRHLLAARSDSHERAAMDVGIVVDPGLAPFRIQRAFGRDDPLRLATAVPKPARSIQVTHVARAMPRVRVSSVNKRRVTDFRNRIGVDARDVFWRDLWSTYDELSDFV